MQELVQIGPFRCEQSLATAVGLFVGTSELSKSVQNVMEALEGNCIFVRQKEDVSLGLFDKEISTIWIQTGHGKEEKDPLWRAAKKTWVLVFETFNAILYPGYESVPLTNVEAYVEGMELNEYCVAKKTEEVIQEIKRVNPELMGCSHFKYFNKFETHYLEQQLAGHSNRFIYAYWQRTGRAERFQGTWPNPVVAEWQPTLTKIKSAVFWADQKTLKGILPTLTGDALANANHFLAVAGVTVEFSPQKQQSPNKNAFCPIEEQGL